MINITSQVTESILNSTESTTATSTTNTITTSSSSATFLTNNTSSDTNNITTTTITTTTTNDKDIITINNVNAIREDLPAEEEKTYNLNMPTLTATLLTASTNIITSSNNTDSANNISIDSSDSSISPGNSNLPSGRDISCIDLTEGDDDIEILTEKLTRPAKRRKRDNKTSPSSTSCSCSLRPHRNSLEIYRESSDLPLSSNRHPSLSPRTVHHHPPSLTPLPSISPSLLPNLSLQELISPPRSDSFIVDLAHSPPPSTSSSSNKNNNSIDVLTESLPKRKNIPTPPPPEPARYKIVKCPICLEEDHKILAAGGEIVVTICGHVYCKSCLQQAIKTNHFCPNCRKKLTQRSYHRIFL